MSRRRCRRRPSCWCRGGWHRWVSRISEVRAFRAGRRGGRVFLSYRIHESTSVAGSPWHPGPQHIASTVLDHIIPVAFASPPHPLRDPPRRPAPLPLPTPSQRPQGARSALPRPHVHGPAAAPTASPAAPPDSGRGDADDTDGAGGAGAAARPEGKGADDLWSDDGGSGGCDGACADAV
ncbi:hypothetical protein FPV67DRAFT_276402 [Lyophyllum atratum]|nr:hypothetical protein FPV67DRAFT_276402 [Lyophyllum atratum]